MERSKLLAACLLVSPISALILVLASGLYIPLIIFLYAVVVIEGIGVSIWALSRISSEDITLVTRENSDSKPYYYAGRNKAETLNAYIKSAASRRPNDFRRYSRTEIAAVLSSIVEKDHSEAKDHQLPQEEERLSPELDFLLHPQQAANKESNLNDSPRDYLSSLDNVLSEIESGVE